MAADIPLGGYRGEARKVQPKKLDRITISQSENRGFIVDISYRGGQEGYESKTYTFKDKTAMDAHLDSLYGVKD